MCVYKCGCIYMCICTHTTHTHTYTHIYTHRQRSKRKHTTVLAGIWRGGGGTRCDFYFYFVLYYSVSAMKTYGFYTWKVSLYKEISIYSSHLFFPAVLSCLLKGFIGCFALPCGRWSEVLFPTSSLTPALSWAVSPACPRATMLAGLP